MTKDWKECNNINLGLRTGIHSIIGKKKKGGVECFKKEIGKIFD